jgi:hypothetical protein
MADFKLKFVREKTTTRTVRFKEQPPEGAPPVVGYLYVQQSVAGPAREVSVVLTLVDDKDTSGPKRKA